MHAAAPCAAAPSPKRRGMHCCCSACWRRPAACSAPAAQLRRRQGCCGRCDARLACHGGIAVLPKNAVAAAAAAHVSCRLPSRCRRAGAFRPHGGCKRPTMGCWPRALCIVFEILGAFATFAVFAKELIGFPTPTGPSSVRLLLGCSNRPLPRIGRRRHHGCSQPWVHAPTPTLQRRLAWAS